MPRKGIHKRRRPTRRRLYSSSTPNTLAQQEIEDVANTLMKLGKETTLYEDIMEGVNGNSDSLKRSSGRLIDTAMHVKNSGWSVNTFISLLKLLE